MASFGTALGICEEGEFFKEGTLFTWLQSKFLNLFDIFFHLFGMKIGFFRLITIWPFLDRQIYGLAEMVDSIYVVECNLDGQLAREVQRASLGKAEVVHVGKAGVEMHTPDEVVEAIQKHISVRSKR